jgi:MFS family permease
MLFVCGWFIDRFVLIACWRGAFFSGRSPRQPTSFWVYNTPRDAAAARHRRICGIPMLLKVLAQHLPEHRRGFANGAIIAGMKCGPVVGTLGAGVLMAKYGWRPVFIGIGLLSLVWLPAWMRWMPRGEASPHPGVSPRVIDILRQRSFWATAAGGFCLAYPLYFMITWLPFYLSHEQHLSMRDMVNTAALYYAVDAAAALITGWMTDFWIGRGSVAGTCTSQPRRSDGPSQRSALWVARLPGCALFWVVMVTGGVRNRQFWHLGVFADLSWAARCWKMDRVAKRFCKPGRCGWTGAHWVYRGLDWTLSSGAGDNGGSLPVVRN